MSLQLVDLIDIDITLVVANREVDVDLPYQQKSQLCDLLELNGFWRKGDRRNVEVSKRRANDR